MKVAIIVKCLKGAYKTFKQNLSAEYAKEDMFQIELSKQDLEFWILELTETKLHTNEGDILILSIPKRLQKK